MLLSSYLVSFTLLVLTTALFVRSANEMRLAERHAETQRAFWLSEAALDAALADLKTDAPPDLAVGACATEHAVPFTANTISTATYTLCLKLEDVANGTRTYSLTTTGRESGTSESLYSLVEYEQGMIEFNYAAYASDIIFFNSLSGSMDTDAQNQLIGDLTFQGDIAVWKSDNFIHTPDGSLRYDSDGNPMKGRSPVVIYKGSVINGDVYVGPDAAEPDALVEVGQGSIIRGTVKKLAAVQKLPPVEVPPDAKPLADIIGAHASDKWCLEPGTYVVENVVFGLGLGSPELCTTGSVDLYVTKRFSVPNGSLYGQPEGSRPFAKNYSPENLRIFVKGDNDILFGFGPGVGAAMLYAPTSMFQMLGNGTWLGGVIADLVFPLGTAGYSIAYDKKAVLLYDEALRGKQFPVGPPRVTTLMWTTELREKTVTACASVDFNSDQTVDIRDVSAMRPAFGSRTNDTRYDARYDLNADGTIDLQDVSAVRKYFGGCSS